MRGVCEKVLQHWAGFKYVQKNLNKPWGARMLWVVPPEFCGPWEMPFQHSRRQVRMNLP
jgi:hypothetical protein